MTQRVILTQPVRVGGSVLAAGTQQTLALDIAADIVARGFATPIGVPAWQLPVRSDEFLGALLDAGLQPRAVGSPSALKIQFDSSQMYVRSPWDATLDCVQRVLLSPTRTAGANNPLEFGGARKIANSTALSSTVSEWTGSGASAPIANQLDDAPPVKINSQWIGGNHLATIGKSCTSNAHGKTAADIGSRWDGPYSKDYRIAAIPDANTLVLFSAATGANSATNWGHEVTPLHTFSYPHVSGASNTATFTVTASATTTIGPVLNRRFISVRVDDAEIDYTVNATYAAAEKLEVIEQYGICSPPALWDWLGTKAGTLANNWTPDDTVACDIFVTYAWRFAANGSVSVTASYSFERSVTVNYLGGAQALAPYASGYVIHGYVPAVSPVTVGANTYDLKAVASLAAIPADVPLASASWVNASNPPDLLALIPVDGSTKQMASVLGFSPTYGQTARSLRSTKIDSAGFFGASSRKLYPYSMTGAAFSAGIAAPGQLISINAYRHNQKLVGETVATIAFYAWDGDDILVLMDFHETSARTVVAVPSECEGWNISVILQESCELMSPVVVSGVVAVSCSASYGRVRLRVYR